MLLRYSSNRSEPPGLPVLALLALLAACCNSSKGISPPNPDNLVEAEFSGYFGQGSHVAKTGYLYAPDACRGDARDCGLHIAFHGCVQGAEFIEDRFASQSGFNEWAESNKLIIAYPQVEKSLFNPRGCWDWWEYTDDDYDLRAGKQVAGVAALVDSHVSGTLLP